MGRKTNKSDGAMLLKYWRRQKRLNQEDAARLLGCHQSTVSLLERGKRSPSRPFATRLHRITRISPRAWTNTYTR